MLGESGIAQKTCSQQVLTLFDRTEVVIDDLSKLSGITVR